MFASFTQKMLILSFNFFLYFAHKGCFTNYVYWTFSVFSQYVYCTNWLQETNYGLQLQASEVTTFCFLETTFCFLLTDKLVYWSVESSFLVSRRQSLNLYKRLQHSQVSLQLKRKFLQFLKELRQGWGSNPRLHQ